MAKKKEKDFRYFWEEPIEQVRKTAKEAGSTIGAFLEKEPMELHFNMPHISFPSSSFPINISETDKEIIVEAHLPGFKKDEITLDITEKAIRINAHKKKAREEKGKGFHIKEAGYASVSRSFSLPSEVDPDHVSAKLEDGVLRITMKKLYPEKKKRKAMEIK